CVERTAGGERLVGVSGRRARWSPLPTSPLRHGRSRLLRAPQAVEERVNEREDLGPRAEVGRQREAAGGGGVAGLRSAQRLLALSEQPDVGVAEAVDRLPGIPDEEQVPLAPEKVEKLALEAVGVLEFVDHQIPQPRAEAGANG